MREDFLQKYTTELVRTYDIICLETLKVKNMVQNHKLAQAILDVSWSKFVEILKYKCEWYGKKLIQIDTFFASSQTCHVCGYKNEDTKNFNIREWICPNCKTQHDRDINASINILNEGLKLA
jgi:putative transposase